MSDVVDNLSLSVYAFGYGARFVKDDRVGAQEAQAMSLMDVVHVALKHGLGGVEVPVDKYFPDPSGEGLGTFLDFCRSSGLRVIFALEKFSSEYFNAIAPVVSSRGLDFVRVKVCDFYGGNRHLEKSYLTKMRWFGTELSRCTDAIDRYGVKILIENHQDLTLADILGFIQVFGSNRIGVNWDTGNSFPTGETVESFSRKCETLIGNVHLKDYRVSRVDNGYSMHRCALGDGIVDLEFVVRHLMALSKGTMPFTIELAAFSRRTACIEDPEYWEFVPDVSQQHVAELKDFLYKHVEPDEVISSLLERGALPSAIRAAEMVEVERSIEHCKALFHTAPYM